MKFMKVASLFALQCGIHVKLLQWANENLCIYGTSHVKLNLHGVTLSAQHSDIVRVRRSDKFVKASCVASTMSPVGIYYLPVHTQSDHDDKDDRRHYNTYDRLKRNEKSTC